MRRHPLLILVGAGLLLAGCRTITRVAEVPRVDQRLGESGNRGYVVGTPPAASALKPTRQMVATDIEIPSLYRARRSSTPFAIEQLAPPEVETDEAGTSPAPRPGQAYDTYVVQPGDSLWSIAAKPEIYGRAARWRLLFDANRDLLQTPDRLKAGMTLKIPRGEGIDGGGPEEDEGATFRK